MTQLPDQHKEKRVELILQQLEELPTLPAVAVKVLELTADSTSSAGDVCRLIASDPALTARILQLVHRADLGVRGEVNSIDRAVMLLGFDAVRSAVLAVSVFEALAVETRPAGNTGHFSREEFWKHCVAVACCAELLAARSTGILPVSGGARHGQDARGTSDGQDARSTAFICGLLHDLGKVALDAILPKSFSRVVE